jgi:DNA polymerase-3 subunit alpha
VEVIPQTVAVLDEVVEDVVFDEENPQEPEIELITEIEEIKVITKLEMPSRKLKIKISNELLFELEKMQVDFRLN